MSKDIKNLIDDIEEQNKTRAELEHTIEKLKEEIKRLKLEMEEQKVFIQVSDTNVENKISVPEDIQILKDMIISQRKDLVQKDRDIEMLTQKLEAIQVSEEKFVPLRSNNSGDLIAQLNSEIETYKTNEDDAKKLIEQLLEENETYRLEIRTLKAQLKSLGYTPSKFNQSQGIELKAKKKKKQSRKKSV